MYPKNEGGFWFGGIEVFDDVLFLGFSEESARKAVIATEAEIIVKVIAGQWTADPL